VALRASRRLGPARLAGIVGVPATTVHPARTNTAYTSASGASLLRSSGWALEPDLESRTPEQVKDLLVPTIARALAGG
jgi:hypothetical protein